MNALKEKILTGQIVHGSWLSMGASLSAEIVGKAGFDWVCIDLEHGAGTEKEVIHQLQGLHGGKTTPIVRVESLEKLRSQRVLDMGASGIMFPQIRSAADAQQAVANMYYPPIGARGAAQMVRALDFASKDFGAYRANLSKHLINFIQIETLEALKEVDQIAAIDGVDVLFVGPSDLSIAMGIFGQIEHKDFQEALQLTAQAARKHGKAAGVLLLDPKQLSMYHMLGFTVFAMGSDLTFLSKGAKATLHLLQQEQEKLK